MPPYSDSDEYPSSAHLPPLKVLYEDNHLIAVFKPPGLLVQGDASGDLSLLELTKEWLKKKYGKPGKVFLGLLHRLDKPVSGVVLFAKTSKAAGRLSEQFRKREIRKIYHALVEGLPAIREQVLIHFLSQEDGQPVSVSSGPGPDRKEARLRYRIIKTHEKTSLLEVELETGRKHQIRAQLSAIGHPIVGDKKYGAASKWSPEAIGLVSMRLEFEHPTKHGERVMIELAETLSLLGDKGR